jgi:hypothetical protein
MPSQQLLWDLLINHPLPAGSHGHKCLGWFSMPTKSTGGTRVMVQQGAAVQSTDLGIYMLQQGVWQGVDAMFQREGLT